jgi:hypothetical protein
MNYATEMDSRDSSVQIFMTLASDIQVILRLN